jgi:hypothetical protein
MRKQEAPIRIQESGIRSQKPRRQEFQEERNVGIVKAFLVEPQARLLTPDS